MEAVLGSVGGQIVRAHSGEEALRILLERDFALILLDVQMPTLGGFETARLIRERRRSRHTPIIFITAHGRDEQDVRAAYELGAVDFLFKPVVTEILRSKVSVFVELHRRSAQLALQAEQLRAHERREHERAMEEERRKWNEDALRRQMAELAEADRRKDEFLAVLGHELRNPLSAIVVATELLRQKLDAIPGIDEAIVRHRNRIDRQAQHLKRLVDDLLDLARINSGKVELKKSVTTIQHIVDEVAQTAMPQLAEHRQHLAVEVPPEAVTLFVDPVRLIQAVGNLVNNAIRYSGQGAHIRIDCAVDQSTGTLRIAVQDDGHGIKAELLPRIFDVFVQGQGAATGNGLGLGLTIVQRLVNMHGGSVSAASDGPGSGATFTITLPLAPGVEQVAAPASTPTAKGTSSRSLRIVVVEDNDDIREPMGDLLRSLGHDVRTSAAGSSGADLILAFKPNVAILDIGLPGLNGYEVARRVVSELAPAERPRLIAMTGYGQETDRKRTREAGFDAHLVKPADVDTLIRAVSGESAAPPRANESQT